MVLVPRLPGAVFRLLRSIARCLRHGTCTLLASSRHALAALAPFVHPFSLFPLPGLPLDTHSPLLIPSSAALGRPSFHTCGSFLLFGTSSYRQRRPRWTCDDKSRQGRSCTMTLPSDFSANVRTSLPFGGITGIKPFSPRTRCIYFCYLGFAPYAT